MSSILYDSQTSVSRSTFLQSLESSQAYENDEYDHDRSITGGASEHENLNFSQLMAKADNQGSILLNHHPPTAAGNGFPNGGAAGDELPSLSTQNNNEALTRTSSSSSGGGLLPPPPISSTHPIPQQPTHNNPSSSMHNPNQYHYKDEILSVSAARLGEETFQVRGFACRSNTHTPAPSSSNGISTSTNNDLLTVQQVMNFASNPALLSRWCAPIRNLTITKDSSSSSSSGTHTPSTSRFQNQQFMNQQQAHQQSPIPPPLHYNNNNNKNQYEYDGEWVEGDAALVNPGSKCGLYNVSSMVLQQLSDGFQKASRLLLPESTSSSTPLTATTRGSGDNAYMYSNPMQNSNLSQQQQQQQGNVTLFIERKRGQLAITMSPVGGCEVTYTLTFQQSSSSANTSTNNTSTTTATRIGVQIINTVRVDRSSVNCCYGAVVPRSVKEWVLPSMASHIQQGIDAMELLIQLVQQNANAGDVVNSSSGSFDNSPTLSGGGMYAGVLGTLSNAIGGRFGVDNSNETKVPLLDATL